MLFQVAVTAIFSYVVSGTIPQGLLVVTNIKDNVHKLTKNLDDFRSNMKTQIRVLENSLWENRKKDEPAGKHMYRTMCLQTEIPQARMEVNRLLNMLVDGEKNQLITVESSLIDMKFPAAELDVQALHRVWGSLAAHGESRRKIRSEMANFSMMVKNRFEEVRKSCIGPKARKITKSVKEKSDHS